MASVHMMPGRCSGYWLLFILLPLFNSCNSYNFSDPQPVDRENIYEFPDAFLGKWEEVDTFSTSFEVSIPVKGPSATNNQPIRQYSAGTRQLYQHRFGKNAPGEDSSHMRIAKNYVQLIFHMRERVVLGAWPKKDQKGELVFPGDFLFSDNLEREIKYDSLKRATDTIDNYLFYNNLIYQAEHNLYLRKGYPFYYDHDTIVILKHDTICIDLGQNAFLRQLDEKRYAFNFLYRLLGEDGTRFEPWWSLRILELNGPGKFLMWECSSKTGELPSMFHEAISKADIFYFNSQWTTAELLSLLQQGYFETGGSYYLRK